MIDRLKKFQQNSQNYLIPDKTTKSDVLGNNDFYQMSLSQSESTILHKKSLSLSLSLSLRVMIMNDHLENTYVYKQQNILAGPEQMHWLTCKISAVLGLYLTPLYKV